MSDQREVREQDEDVKTAGAEAAGEQPGEGEAPVTEEAGDAGDRLQELEALAEERRDQALRAQAELENQRRRFERELENAHKYAMEKFAAELLDICDSLEMGVQAARESQDVERIIEGAELTLKNLNHVFEKFGIQAEEPTGERFDPERHQAMSMQEDASQPPNTVVATMQKGYLLQDRVLRPAMVVVSKAPAAGSGEQDS